MKQVNAQQLSLDIDRVNLPRPAVTQTQIRHSDVPIARDSLQIPDEHNHRNHVLWAIQALSGSTMTEQFYPSTQIGYTQIQTKINKSYGFTLAKSSIALFVEDLLRLGFLKRVKRANFAAACEYQALTDAGMLAMLAGVGATHYRVTRRRVILIAPEK